MSEESDKTRGEGSGKGSGAGGKKPAKGMPEGLPEGMRVVRKRRKKRGSSRQTLFLKKREILREMHDDGGAVGLKEQVERLKSARKAREKDKPLEERWGGPAAKHRGARWIVLRAFAIIIPILAIVTAFLLTKGKEGDQPIVYDSELDLGKSEGEEVKLPYDAASPVGWFNDNPHAAYEEMVTILDRLNELEPGARPENLLRNEEAVMPRIVEGGIGWSSDFNTADPRKLRWFAEQSGGEGFIVMEGRREDHEKFRAYFVKTPEGLRLDWEATTAWCEVPFARFTKEAPAEPFLVRCQLVKEPNFDTGSGPASLYSWYLIRSGDESEHAWAYAPAGGDLDKRLLKLFRFGWIVLERLDSVRVTMRLSKSELSSRPTEFGIEELVAEEWVLP